MQVVVRVRPPLPRELRGTGLRPFQCTTLVEKLNIITLSDNLASLLQVRQPYILMPFLDLHRSGIHCLLPRVNALPIRRVGILFIEDGCVLPFSRMDVILSGEGLGGMYCPLGMVVYCSLQLGVDCHIRWMYTLCVASESESLLCIAELNDCSVLNLQRM